VKLLRDFVTGIKNTVFCQKNVIQSERSHKILVFFTFRDPTTLWGMHGSYLNDWCGASKSASTVTAAAGSSILVMFIENSSRLADELTILIVQ
jgi:hypothetical protein